MPGPSQGEPFAAMPSTRPGHVAAPVRRDPGPRQPEHHARQGSLGAGVRHARAGGGAAAAAPPWVLVVRGSRAE
eukprot:11467787-Alexandrium_andersonii.AAC.1